MMQQSGGCVVITKFSTRPLNSQYIEHKSCLILSFEGGLIKRFEDLWISPYCGVNLLYSYKSNSMISFATSDGKQSNLENLSISQINPYSISFTTGLRTQFGRFGLQFGCNLSTLQDKLTNTRLD